MVSTDLDGTLLDHHTYDWQPAKPGMEILESLNAPIIINTSKTYEEVIKLQSELGIQEPFVVENGSALYLPKSKYPHANSEFEDGGNYWQITFGETRDAIVAAIHKLREQQGYTFIGFSDMTLQQLIEYTNLPEENAQLALQRRFSEPLIWQDSDSNYEQFKTTLEARNFKVIKGGRFTHILGETNKGIAILWFKAYYEKLHKVPVDIVALGDSQNDIDMLKIAAYAVAVRSPVHDYPEFITQGSTLKTQGFGPNGWTEAIQQITRVSK